MVGQLAGDACGVRRREDGLEERHVDADGEDFDCDGAAEVVDAEMPAAGLVIEPEEARAGGEEVACVVEGVESDEIGVEEGAEEVVADGDGAEDLGGGEGGVEEEAEAGAGVPAAEIGREGEEVVVVGPDVTAVGVAGGVEGFRDSLGEETVGGEVRPPESGVKEGGTAAERQQAVEERPEVVLAEAVVEFLMEIGGDEDGDAFEVF